MTFEEAKARSDYQFDINELDSIIEDIRKGSMDSLFENGDPYRGAAVLVIGHVDIEVNVHTYEQCSIKAGSKKPVISYFVCVKHGNTDDDWESDDYVDDYKPSVDWTEDNWRDLLEKDMFQALNQYVTKKAYSYDFPN